MSQETVIYITNIVIVVILAGLITDYWLRQGRSEAMRWWMISAWVMATADVLFAVRPDLPPWIGRIAPTLLVTVGQVGLYLGARKSANLGLSRLLAGGIVLLHAAILVIIFLKPHFSSWRMVCNGVIWAGLSVAAWHSLRRAPEPFWKPLVAPANAFLFHALFHCVRVFAASVFATQGWRDDSTWLQTIGDLEVSFFMVALFVGILMANLQMRNEELTHALAEVHTLSGLLPICSWCKKIRDDDGYWKRVEDYFASHSQIKFTHGICNDCFQKLHPHGHKTPPAPPTT